MKKLISAVTTATFILALALATQAATAVECEVMAAKEDTVIMNCGDQTGKMTVGAKVTLQQPQVNTKKKATVIEGC